jgi:hypothetical protein
MDKVQKPSNSEGCTPPSEPLRFYLNYRLHVFVAVSFLLWDLPVFVFKHTQFLWYLVNASSPWLPWEHMKVTSALTSRSPCPSYGGKGKRKSYPCNRPWRPIRLWDAEASIFYRQSAYRWQWGCQPYAPALLYSTDAFVVLISVTGWVKCSDIVQLEGVGKLKKKKNNDHIGTRTRELPVRSIEPRPSVRRLLAKLVPTFADRGCQRNGSLRPYSQISRSEPLLFLSSSSSIVLTRLSGPRSRPTTSQKIWKCRESNPALWICRQELWPLDHRGPHRKHNTSPICSQELLPLDHRGGLLSSA